MIPDTHVRLKDLKRLVLGINPLNASTVNVDDDTNEWNSLFQTPSIRLLGLDPRFCSGLEDLRTQPYDIGKFRGYYPMWRIQAYPINSITNITPIFMLCAVFYSDIINQIVRMDDTGALSGEAGLIGNHNSNRNSHPFVVRNYPGIVEGGWPNEIDLFRAYDRIRLYVATNFAGGSASCWIMTNTHHPPIISPDLGNPNSDIMYWHICDIERDEYASDLLGSMTIINQWGINRPPAP